MSVWNWLFSKTSSKTAVSTNESSKADASLPVKEATADGTAADPLVDIKQQRHVRREQLYEVVRNVMLRSEVLASHYKFKVLSLDTHGRQYLVMVDLLGDHILPSDRWAPVEQLMGLTAAQRHDLHIKAVYWRLMMPAPMAASKPPIVAPAAVVSPPIAPVVATPAVAQVAAIVAATPTSKGGFEPINHDEVLAFKKAMAAATGTDEMAPTEPGEVVTSGPRQPMPEPGYEDTQMLEPDDTGSPLSGTQFGGLN